MPSKYDKKWSAHLILRPIPPHQTPPLGPRRVILPWTPKGNCRCLSVSMIFSLVKSLLKPLLKSRSKYPCKILSKILSKTLRNTLRKILNQILRKILNQNYSLYVWTFRPNNRKVTYLWCFWKFWPPTPNLTSNFETHNNVGDNFYFV